MNELERMVEQDNLMYYAMYDSYRIITNKISPIRFLMEKDKQDVDFILLFDAQDLRTLTKDTLENIIDYFSDLEEYEMCAELVAYKKKRKWK
tara:strand:+ start:1501 stop:1776 length:276 start_codon:yes stop_codon:yes gene_type:complete